MEFDKPHGLIQQQRLQVSFWNRPFLTFQYKRTFLLGIIGCLIAAFTDTLLFLSVSIQSLIEVIPLLFSLFSHLFLGALILWISFSTVNRFHSLRFSIGASVVLIAFNFIVLFSNIYVTYYLGQSIVTLQIPISLNLIPHFTLTLSRPYVIGFLIMYCIEADQANILQSPNTAGIFHIADIPH